MKPLALLPAAAAVLFLAACSSHASTGSTPAAPATVKAAKAPTCKQQYKTWQAGPAKAAGLRLATGLKKVSSAGSSEDIPLMDSALKQSGDAAAALQADHLPHCADPAGYYGRMLARITAAGDNAKSGGSGFGGLLLAAAPLKTVPGIEAKLTKELDRTVGKNR